MKRHCARRFMAFLPFSFVHLLPAMRAVFYPFLWPPTSLALDYRIVSPFVAGLDHRGVALFFPQSFPNDRVSVHHLLLQKGRKL